MASQATYTFTTPPKPALTPPPGVIPNFEQPYTLLPYVELTIAPGIFLTTILVASRMFVKAKVVKKYLWEDWTCLFAWICYIVFVSLEWRAGIRGGGTHQWNLRYDDFKHNLWISNYSDMMYCLSIGSIKLSILLLINRIFLAVNRNVLFWLTQALMWANSLFYAIAFFLAIFACRPRHKIWSPEIDGKCLNSMALYIVSATFNTGSDILMLSIPIYMIWTLQMSTKRKMGITAIFSTGAVFVPLVPSFETFINSRWCSACICSIVRIFFEIKLIGAKDFTYIHMETGLLGYAEVACGIICGCLPILPLFWHHLSRSTGHSGNTINMKNMNGLGTNRGGHEAYPTHEPVAGKSWVKLEDGSIAPMPRIHPVEREASDERALTRDEAALNEAIIGLK
ncbi:MAG: hypothetical protein Q9200_004349 [Gallowayella weberi]